MEFILANDDTKCFVCKKSEMNLSSIVSTTAICSGVSILDIFYRFGFGSNFSFGSSLCSLCLAKINEYDLAYESAERIRSELISLLTNHRNDASNVTLSSGGIDIDNKGYHDHGLNHMQYIKLEPKNGMVTNELEPKIRLVPENDLESNYEMESMDELEPKNEIDDTHEVKQNSKAIKIPAHHKTKNTVQRNRYKNNQARKKSKEKNIKTESLSDINFPEADGTSTVKSETNESEVKTPKLESYNCTQKGCDAKFNTPQAFLVHRKETGHKKYLVCDVCDQRFDRKPRYIAHMSFHNGGFNPFECNVCGKKLAQKVGLIRHQRLHTGEQPYQCDHCGKRFTHNTSFIAHKLIHENVRGKKCTVCSLQLGPNASLKIHMMIHTGEKPHECPVCKKRFNKRYNMRSHLRIHQGLDPVPLKTCQLCSKTFTRIGKLKEHMVKDHNFVTASLETN